MPQWGAHGSHARAHHLRCCHLLSRVKWRISWALRSFSPLVRSPPLPLLLSLLCAMEAEHGRPWPTSRAMSPPPLLPKSAAPRPCSSHTDSIVPLSQAPSHRDTARREAAAAGAWLAHHGPPRDKSRLPVGIHVQRAMPDRPGRGLAWHEGHQSKPDTVRYHAGPGRSAGWLTRPRLGTVILTRVVPGWRHGGPVVPGRAWFHKQKKTLQNSEFKGNIQIYFRFN
jgi:hypothetical protein